MMHAKWNNVSTRRNLTFKFQGFPQSSRRRRHNSVDWGHPGDVAGPKEHRAEVSAHIEVRTMATAQHVKERREAVRPKIRRHSHNWIPRQVWRQRNSVAGHLGRGIQPYIYVTVSNVYPGATHQSFSRCDLTSSLWNIADGLLRWRQPTESWKRHNSSKKVLSTMRVCNSTQRNRKPSPYCSTYPNLVSLTTRGKVLSHGICGWHQTRQDFWKCFFASKLSPPTYMAA